MDAEMVQQAVVWIKEAALVMQQTGGDSVVRESAKGVWDWLRTKFKKPSAVAKVDALKESPADDEAFRKLVDLIVDAVQDGDIDAEELKAKVADVEEKITAALPEKAAEIKQNIVTITGSGNVSVQDVQDSTINIQTKS